MPGIVSGTYNDRDVYYSSYVSTYIERDVRELSGNIDALKFNRFITSMAARSAQMINYSGLICYLTKWSSPETAECGAMSGALIDKAPIKKGSSVWCHFGISYMLTLEYPMP